MRKPNQPRYGEHFPTENETLFEGNPPISTRRVCVPSVPAANAPLTLKLPAASVLLQSVLFQDLPLLVPTRWTVVFGTPFAALSVHAPPGQNLMEDSVNTGTSGPQWRSLFGMFTVVGFPAEMMNVL